MVRTTILIDVGKKISNQRQNWNSIKLLKKVTSLLIIKEIVADMKKKITTAVFLEN